jgi:acyl-CoA synthetase (NDP forming)
MINRPGANMREAALNPAAIRPTSAVEAIHLLMSPRSIVFVGASTDLEKTSGVPAHSVAASGYSGKLFAVNRRGATVSNIPTYKSIPEVPESVDIAFVTVKATECPQTIRELALKGVRVAVLGVGGFAETGSETGQRLTKELREASRQSGVRIVGPVCNGIYSTPNHLPLGSNAIHRRALEPGSVGFVSHSGALVAPFVTKLEHSGAGLSRFISAGSEMDLGLADFISYFAEDAQTNVIALIVDHVSDGDAFVNAVRRARRAGKELVALKLGNSPLGREATLAHSSHLSGQKQVYDAIFAAEGVRSVPTVECLALTAGILSMGRRRTKGGVIACSTSGGGAITLADLFSEQHVPVPKLQQETVAEISNHLRFDAARIMNPFDLGLGGRDHYITNVGALARDPAAAVLIVFGTTLQTPAKRMQITGAAVEAARVHPDLPVIYLSPAPLLEDERAVLQEGRIPLCTSTLDAVAVSRALLPVAPVVPEGSADKRRRKLVTQHTGPLSESRSKALLREFGIPMPVEILARTLDEAADAAKTIGFPVVVKASGRGIWHKSENQLLELGIASESELSIAWRRLEERVQALKDVELDGFLVAPYIKDGVEALVGFSRDPEFGPIAVVGPGGVLAELFGKSAMRHLTLPLDRMKVIQALENTPLGKLIAGFRGGETHDLDAFADLVAATAAMVSDVGDSIEELDLNPVKILAKGQGAWVLDALCVFKPAQATSK